jgi:TP901 family phage tail tape measure protein
MAQSSSISKSQSRELERAEKNVDKFKHSLQKAWEEQKKADAILNSETSALRKLGDQYDITSKKVENYHKRTAALEKTKALQDKSAKHMDRANQSMFFAKSVYQVGSSLMIEPLHKALEIEKEFAQVRKNLHYHSEQEAQEHQKKLLEISSKYSVSNMEIMHMAEMGAAGLISKENLVTVTELATKMSNVTKASTQDSMQTMIDWQNGMGLTVEQMKELSDVTVTLFDKSSAKSAGDLMKFTAYAGQFAKTAHLSAKETMAFGSAITGLAPEAASTSFKNMLNVMVSGVHATKQQAVAFSRLGLDVAEVAKSMETDASGTVVNVLKKIKSTIPEYEQAAFTASTFGSSGSEAAIQYMNDLKKLETQLGLVKNSANYDGRLAKETEIVNSSTLNQLEMMKNSLDNIQTTIMQTFIPMLTVLVEKVKSIVDTVKPWIENNKELISTVGKIAMTLGSVTMAVSGMSWLFSGTMAIAIKAIAAAIWLWNSALLANPMTWIMVGAIAVGVILGLAIRKLRENWDDVCAAAKRFGDWSNIQPLLDAGKKIGEAFGWFGESSDKNLNVNVQQSKNLDAELKDFKANQANSQQSLVLNYSPNQTFNGDSPDNLSQFNQVIKGDSQHMMDMVKNQLRFQP